MSDDKEALKKEILKFLDASGPSDAAKVTKHLSGAGHSVSEEEALNILNELRRPDKKVVRTGPPGYEVWMKK